MTWWLSTGMAREPNSLVQILALPFSGHLSKQLVLSCLSFLICKMEADNLIRASLMALILCEQKSIQSKLCFSSSHVWMRELDYKESWVPKNWCFWTVVLEKTLKNPLDCREIQPVHPKGDQSWIFIGRTDAEAETPVLWPPEAKIWLIGKDPDAGKDWRREEKGMTEDERVGWHYWLDGHEFE